MGKDNFEVIFAPNAALASEVKADASVEAEYGNTCIEGSKITLAHHGPRSGNPAPCNAEVEPLEGGTILVSHIDLDTVGGVMAVEGRKPEDPEFWKAAEFIDVNGIHHIHELPQETQDKLNAYYAAEFALRKEEGFPPRDSIKDVTEDIEKRMHAVDIILDERHPEHNDYIVNGIKWEEATAKAVEAQHVFDTENVRVFITEGPFTAASYFSPEDNEVKKATATLNTKTKAVTVAFEDGGNPDKSARAIVQDLWGPEAGGRDGIAGSPRGMVMGTKDLLDAAMKAEEAVIPAINMDRVKELQGLREALGDAIHSNVKERGLEVNDTLGAKEAKDIAH